MTSSQEDSTPSIVMGEPVASESSLPPLSDEEPQVSLGSIDQLRMAGSTFPPWADALQRRAQAIGLPSSQDGEVEDEDEEAESEHEDEDEMPPLMEVSDDEVEAEANAEAEAGTKDDAEYAHVPPQLLPVLKSVLNRMEDRDMFAPNISRAMDAVVDAVDKVLTQGSASQKDLRVAMDTLRIAAVELFNAVVSGDLSEQRYKIYTSISRLLEMVGEDNSKGIRANLQLCDELSVDRDSSGHLFDSADNMIRTMEQDAALAVHAFNVYKTTCARVERDLQRRVQYARRESEKDALVTIINRVHESIALCTAIFAKSKDATYGNSTCLHCGGCIGDAYARARNELLDSQSVLGVPAELPSTLPPKDATYVRDPSGVPAMFCEHGHAHVHRYCARGLRARYEKMYSALHAKTSKPPPGVVPYYGYMRVREDRSTALSTRRVYVEPRCPTCLSTKFARTSFPLQEDKMLYS